MTNHFEFNFGFPRSIPLLFSIKKVCDVYFMDEAEEYVGLHFGPQVDLPVVGTSHVLALASPDRPTEETADQSCYLNFRYVSEKAFQSQGKNHLKRAYLFIFSCHFHQPFTKALLQNTLKNSLINH